MSKQNLKKKKKSLNHPKRVCFSFLCQTKPLAPNSIKVFKLTCKM